MGGHDHGILQGRKGGSSLMKTVSPAGRRLQPVKTPEDQATAIASKLKPDV
jgi:hypothetical protein